MRRLGFRSRSGKSYVGGVLHNSSRICGAPVGTTTRPLLSLTACHKVRQRHSFGSASLLPVGHQGSGEVFQSPSATWPSTIKRRS